MFDYVIKCKKKKNVSFFLTNIFSANTNALFGMALVLYVMWFPFEYKNYACAHLISTSA